MGQEIYTDKLKVQIGKVQASAKANNYFPLVGEIVRIDATTKWAQSTEWQTQDGGGNTVTAAGTVSGQKDSKEVVITNPGELQQKLVARNYLTETVVSKTLYAMQPQILPYFDVTATEVVRVGDTGYINIMAENGYPTSRSTTIVARIYKENESIPVKTTSFDTSRPGPTIWASSIFSFDNASDRGIYDVEVDVTDTLTGIMLTKRINKLITVTPALCPKPSDTSTGYEVVTIYKAKTSYSPDKQLDFELRLWRDVNGSGLNYAEAILTRGEDPDGRIDIHIGNLPQGTTLCLKKDPLESGPYPMRFMPRGITSDQTTNESGTPNFTHDAPLVVTHDDEGILEWLWRSYGVISMANNIRHVVLDGRGYNNTGIRFSIFPNAYANSAFFLVNGTSDFEMFSCEIAGAGFAGVSAKTDPTPNNPWYWRENGWEMKNLKIHHCNIHDTDGECLYLGYYDARSITGYNSAGQQVKFHAHLLRGVRVYRSTFDNAAYDGVQINNSVETEVCYCDITRSGRERVGDQGLAFACILDGLIYNCRAVDCYGGFAGLRPLFTGIKFFNNIAVAALNNGGIAFKIWKSDEPEYDLDGNGNNDEMYFEIYNNILKATGIMTFNSDINFSKFIMSDNIFITEKPSAGLPGSFCGTGNIFLKKRDEYEEIDAYLKVADSANYNYQPAYNSRLVSAGQNALTPFDMRGYKRWYNKVNHCGPLMGVYKDVTLPDTTIQLLSISINDGTPSTLNRTVSISMSYRGTPVRYRVGEVADLSAISWIDMPASGNIEYTLSDGFGAKTVYAQISDNTEDGNVVSGNITYQATPLSLTALVLSGGYENTADVTFDYEGSYTPAKYRLGEAADLSDATWIDWSDNIIYQFASSGEKTLYGQLQDANGNISEIRSATITVTNDLKFIRFVDPVIEGIALALWDADGDGGITKEEAAVNKRIMPNGCLSGRDDIISLDDLAKLNFNYQGGYANNPNLRTAHTGVNKQNSNGTNTPYEAYMNDLALERLIVDDVVTYIERRSCLNCNSLSTVVWSKNLERIGQNAFTRCALDSVELPNSVTTVDGSSFSEMDTLRYVIMGENIQTLGGAMFGKCTNMEAFVIRTVTPPTISDTFKDCNCLIFVPDESVEAYKTATNWSKYADRIKPLSEYTKEV